MSVSLGLLVVIRYNKVGMIETQKPDIFRKMTSLSAIVTPTCWHHFTGRRSLAKRVPHLVGDSI